MLPLDGVAPASKSNLTFEALARTSRRAALAVTLLLMSPAARAQGVPGAVAHWPFDDQTNPTADVIGGHSGTIVGATFVDDFAPVQGNSYALEFDGMGGNVEVASAPDLQFDSSMPMTICLWVKRTSGSGVVHMLGKRQGCGVGTQGINYQWAFTPGGGIEFASESAGIIFSQQPLALDAWTHLAVTHDGLATTRLYVDAVEVLSSTNYSVSGVNSATLKIGASGSCGESFAGRIDDVWIFNKALSDCEIAEISGISVGIQTYCSPASPNSVDPAGARLSAVGCPSLGANAFGVAAEGLPPGVIGVLAVGQQQAQVPFGNGVLCVGGTVQRVGPAFADAQGQVSLPIDLDGPLSIGNGVQPGDQRFLQLWYRDPMAPPAGFNLSDALAVTFAP